MWGYSVEAQSRNSIFPHTCGPKNLKMQWVGEGRLNPLNLRRSGSATGYHCVSSTSAFVYCSLRCVGTGVRFSLASAEQFADLCIMLMYSFTWSRLTIYGRLALNPTCWPKQVMLHHCRNDGRLTSIELWEWNANNVTNSFVYVLKHENENEHESSKWEPYSKATFL